MINESKQAISGREVIKISSLYNNCALHVLVPFINAFMQEVSVDSSFRFNEIAPSVKERKSFFKTKGYQYFIASFASYYQIPFNSKVEQKIKTFLRAYIHPLDLQVLLGPVLRLALKEVLLKAREHKAGLKPCFLTLANICQDRYRRDFRQGERDEGIRLLWLKNQRFSNQEEYEELFLSNQSLIANLLERNISENIDEIWDQAYKNYCSYQTDPCKGIYISESQLALLCRSFLFKFEYKTQEQQYRCPVRMDFIPLATVRAVLSHSNHWEIANQNNSEWDFDARIGNLAIFEDYHNAAIMMSKCATQEEQSKLLQNIFKQKINKVLIENVDYEEECYDLLMAQTWGNNSGLEGLVQFIVRKISNESIDSALPMESSSLSLPKQPGFNEFLITFCSYYEIKDKVALLLKIKNILAGCTERMHFAIISPVLRKMSNALHNDQPLTLSELSHLHGLFNINLEWYLCGNKKSVSCYHQLYVAPTQEAILTLSLAWDEAWRIVEKDELKAFIETLKRPHLQRIMYEPNIIKKQIQLYFSTGQINLIEANLSHPFNKTYPFGSNIFLSLPWFKGESTLHSKQMVLNAIKERNLELLFKLLQQGAPLPWDNVAAILKASLELTLKNSKESYFGLILQSVMLLFFQLRKLKKNINANGFLHLEPSALEVVRLALEQNAFDWVAQLFYYLQKAPKIFKQERARIKLEENSASWKHQLFYYFKKIPRCLIKEEEIESIFFNDQQCIVELIAKRACKAIYVQDKENLINCLKCNILCLLVPGKFNPFHYAYALQALTFLKTTYIDLFWGVCQAHAEEEINLNHKEVYENIIKQQFNSWIYSAYDEYGRSLGFRLQRRKRTNHLQQQLKNASGVAWLKLQALIMTEALEDKRIFIADRLHKKITHTSQVQQRAIYKYGYPLLFPLKNLGTLAAKGPARFLLDVSGYMLPSYFKVPLLNLMGKTASYTASFVNLSPETIKFYVPYFIDNMLYCAYMPKYYMASTLLHAGAYYLFKDSKWENTEAFSYLLLDGVAHSWAAGGQHNYEIDERYMYHLTKNLAGITGENNANIIAPYIAQVDGFTHWANAKITYTCNGLKDTLVQATAEAGNTEVFVLLKENLAPYVFSSGVHKIIPPLTERIEMISTILAAPVELNERVVNLVKEPLFNYFEGLMLKNLPDSSYKAERCHALQLMEINRLGEKQVQLEMTLNKKKEKLPVLKQSYDEVQAELILAQQQLKKMEADLLIYNDKFKSVASVMHKDELQAQIEVAQQQRAEIKNKISQLSQNFIAIKSEYEPLKNVVESLSKENKQQLQLLERVRSYESFLLKNLSSYPYLEKWQEKLIDLQYEESIKPANSQRILACKKGERAAWQALTFYGNDIVKQIASVRGEQIRDIFTQQAVNFIDMSNLQAAVNSLVDSTFNYSSDRNAMAEHCAHEIIKRNYPLYPIIGNTQEIEAERRRHIQNISTYKLAAHKDKNKKKDLNEYLLATFSGQPEQARPTHHRAVKIWIAKGLADVVAMVISGGKWLPFPEFNEGPSFKNDRHVGLQFSYYHGATNDALNVLRTDLSYNHFKIASVYKGQQALSFAAFPDARALQERSQITWDLPATMNNNRQNLLVYTPQAIEAAHLKPMRTTTIHALDPGAGSAESPYSQMEVFLSNEQGINKKLKKRLHLNKGTLNLYTRDIMLQQHQTCEVSRTDVPIQAATETKGKSKNLSATFYTPQKPFAQSIVNNVNSKKAFMLSPRYGVFTPNSTILKISSNVKTTLPTIAPLNSVGKKKSWVWEHTKAVGQGVKNAAVQLADSFLHPVDTAMGMALTIWDGGNAATDLTLSVSTEKARIRNAKRGQMFHAMGEKFIEGDSITKTEMVAEEVSSFIGGAAVAKLAKGLKTPLVPVSSKSDKVIKASDTTYESIANVPGINPRETSKAPADLFTPAKREGQGHSQAFIPDFERKSLANKAKLNVFLDLQQKNILDASERLTPYAKAKAKVALSRRNTIQNPKVISELLKNGGDISEWKKVSTPTATLSTSQKVQVHFYKNIKTEEVNYNIDYKVKGMVYPLYTTKAQAKKDNKIFMKAYKKD